MSDLTDDQVKAVVNFVRSGGDKSHAAEMVVDMLAENSKLRLAEQEIRAMANQGAVAQGKIRSAPPEKMFSIACAKFGGFYVYEGHPRYHDPSMPYEPAFCCSTLEEALNWMQNKWLLDPEEK
jgi:hypothetical protein